MLSLAQPRAIWYVHAMSRNDELPFALSRGKERRRLVCSLKHMRRALPSIYAGFSHGLAQMSSWGHVEPIARPRRAQSAAEAFRGDWLRIGGDMARAIDKVREDGREKPKP
jgi:hypothetical protein